LLLARDSRRRWREHLRLRARRDIVEVHAPARAAEAPGDGIVGACRLMRGLEGAETDALLTGKRVLNN
jgi:hypothetical protein